MALIYKFKKERLESGAYISRPRIFVVLKGNKASLEVPALIDSGCDTTVIPENIAHNIGIELNRPKNKLYAFRESTDVIESNVNMIFIGKAKRQNVSLNKIPVLVAMTREGFEDESDIILGIEGIFDNFEITFKKLQNKIILKKVVQL